MSIDADAIARTIAYSLDGEYHEGLGLDMSASANGPQVAIRGTDDDGTEHRFTVTVAPETP